MTFGLIFFWVCIALSVPILAGVVASLAKKRRKSAVKTLRVYAVFVVLYIIVLEGVWHLGVPLQIYSMTDDQFLGDWSIGITSVRYNQHDAWEDVEVDFHLITRGSKPVAGDKRLVPFLTTPEGTRYFGSPLPGQPLLSATVQPRKTLFTTWKYTIPANSPQLRMIIAFRSFTFYRILIGRTPFDGKTAIAIR